MNHGGKLAGAELVEQAIGVLYVSGHACSSIEPFRAKRRQRLKNSKA
jgi:hypothetical protein